MENQIAASKMQELIKINVNESGDRTVSARELYQGLGLDKTHWIRWSRKNIVQNDFFKQFTDWQGYAIMANGNETTDYEITLEFAKHLAMMARTPKSHEYRNYFIQCEKKVHFLPPLSKELQAIFMIDEKQQKFEGRLTKLESEMTIDHGQACNVKAAVNKVVKKLCNGNESAAYLNKEIKRKVYSFVWTSLKAYFNITAYHNLLRKDLNQAINYISNLTLQGSLLREIQQANNQMCFKSGNYDE